MDRWTQLALSLPPRRPPHWAVPRPYSQAGTCAFQAPALLWMEAAGQQPKKNGEKKQIRVHNALPSPRALQATQLGTRRLSQLLRGNPTAAAALHGSEPACVCSSAQHEGN